MASIALDRRLLTLSAARPLGSGRRPKPILIIHGLFFTLLASAGLLQPVLQLDSERMLYPACITVSVTLLTRAS